MKLRALNSVKHGGKYFGPGDVFDADKKNAEYLVGQQAAEVYAPISSRPEYDGQALFEESDDLSSLKVDELKAICHYLDIPASGNKSDLVAAIEAVSEEEPE